MDLTLCFPGTTPVTELTQTFSFSRPRTHWNALRDRSRRAESGPHIEMSPECCKNETLRRGSAPGPRWISINKLFTENWSPCPSFFSPLPSLVLLLMLVHPKIKCHISIRDRDYPIVNWSFSLSVSLWSTNGIPDIWADCRRSSTPHLPTQVT